MLQKHKILSNFENFGKNCKGLAEKFTDTKLTIRNFSYLCTLLLISYMMVHQKKRFLSVVFALFCVLAMQAQSSEIKVLQAEMYKYFGTPEQEKFMEVTESLKERCLEVGEERMFYKAWGNQAIYLSTHEQRSKAMDVVGEMRLYAVEHDSRYGEYMALHVQGTVYLRMQNYISAENSFKDAIEFLRTHFPEESPAADYLELVTVANYQNDLEAGKKYGEKVLKESRLEPQYKVKAYAMLCQYAFKEGNSNRFRELYGEWKELVRQTNGGTLDPTVETEYLVINGQYDEALKMCEQVPIISRANLQARIYHLKGDNANAYKYLRIWNEVRDSINRENQSNIFSEYITQSHNERLENERLRLEDENSLLRTRAYIILVVAVIVILVILLYQRQRTVKHLRRDNKSLDNARQEAEQARHEVQKALDIKREFLYNISQELRTPLNPITGMSDLLTDDEFHLEKEERVAMSQHIKENSKLLTKMVDNMIELSFYESKTSLPMDDPISLNSICRSIVDVLRIHSPKSVEVSFETSVPSNLLVKTNVEAVEKVIKHLVNNAIEHTGFGNVIVRCDQQGNYFSIAVEDTGSGVAPELVDHIFNMTAEASDYTKTTGMGLTICKAIIKLLDGRIYLDEKYKKGARFVFEIPIYSDAK